MSDLPDPPVGEGKPNIGETTDGPEVSRALLREERAVAKRRRALAWAGVAVSIVVIAVIAVVVASSGSDDKAGSPGSSTTTSVAASSTTVETVPVDAHTTMPLTGLPPDGNDPQIAARLAGPALAVKIDNDPGAQPQAGIADADVVVEVRVEGISRYIAVFQTRIPDLVGPVRSARTSDPDLLAMFAKPVFAWSGGNSNVMKVIQRTPWIEDASHSAQPDFYFRESGRRAPHNLLIRAPQLLEASRSAGLPPGQLFQYLGTGEESGGLPISGFDISVGSTVASFRWDDALGKWVRHDGKGPQKAADGAPVAATNVLVLQTKYVPSPADKRSPEAESLGEGAAWVFTQGRVLQGRWSRPNREQAWSIHDDVGTPIKLTPGSTWVALPDPGQSPRPVG